jgi:hypothetical protein
VRDFVEREHVGVGLCPGILLGDSCAELDVLAEYLPERFVVGHARLVEYLHVRLDESFALLVGNAVQVWSRPGEQAG